VSAQPLIEIPATHTIRIPYLSGLCLPSRHPPIMPQVLFNVLVALYRE